MTEEEFGRILRREKILEVDRIPEKLHRGSIEEIRIPIASRFTNSLVKYRGDLKRLGVEKTPRYFL